MLLLAAKKTHGTSGRHSLSIAASNSVWHGASTHARAHPKNQASHSAEAECTAHRCLPPQDQDVGRSSQMIPRGREKGCNGAASDRCRGRWTVAPTEAFPCRG